MDRAFIHRGALVTVGTERVGEVVEVDPGPDEMRVSMQIDRDLNDRAARLVPYHPVSNPSETRWHWSAISRPAAG
jgi:hypothetical protein